MKKFLCAIAATTALAIAGLSHGSIITYQFGLDGLQEVPPVKTTGWGTAIVTIDTDTRELTWNVEYHDLLGNSTAAHFHGPADFGENAGVQVGMPGDPTPFGGQSGTLIGDAIITESQLADLLAGLWYINIHSDLYPAGEIRGQVVGVVPAPGAFALLGIGAVMGCRGRRRCP